MKTNGNEPAHPIKNVGVTVIDGGRNFYIAGDPSRSDLYTNFGGLTKREHFAARALQGMLSGRKGGLYDFDEKTCKLYADK